MTIKNFLVISQQNGQKEVHEGIRAGNSHIATISALNLHLKFECFTLLLMLLYAIAVEESNNKQMFERGDLTKMK